MMKLHKAIKETIARIPDGVENDHSAICEDCGQTVTSWYEVDDDRACWTKWSSKETGSFCKVD